MTSGFADLTYTTLPEDKDFWSKHLPYHNRTLTIPGDGCVVCAIRFGVPGFELYGNKKGEYECFPLSYPSNESKENPNWSIENNKKQYKNSPQGLLVEEWNENNN